MQFKHWVCATAVLVLWLSTCSLLQNVAASPIPGQYLHLVCDPLNANVPAAVLADYRAPASDGPVVALIDEEVEPLFSQLINDGGNEQGSIAREDRDVFAGVEAVRVTPMQKYRTLIPGWGYKIRKSPTKGASEFRYIRFAWKKHGGTGIMLQLHDPTKGWIHRYFAGKNVYGWQPAIEVSPTLPEIWEIVTRDLFTDFGEITISGIALTAFDGTDGLFDHILIGQSIEDLDRATDTALGRIKPTKVPEGKARDNLWDDLLGTDAKKATHALQVFLASAPEHVKFVRDRLSDLPQKDENAPILKLIRELNADDFDIRDSATDQLVKLGSQVIELLQEANRAAVNDEVRFRTNVILKKLGGVGGMNRSARLSRVVRILERAATAEARATLSEIAEGKLAPEVASDAKAALARMPKN